MHEKGLKAVKHSRKSTNLKFWNYITITLQSITCFVCDQQEIVLDLRISKKFGE